MPPRWIWAPANDLKMLMKLKSGHCSYALEELEYIIGAREWRRRVDG